MKLPILTEAQILGVKHPIVKGIARFLHHEKSYSFTSSDCSLILFLGSRVYITSTLSRVPLAHTQIRMVHVLLFARRKNESKILTSRHRNICKQYKNYGAI